MNQRNFSMNNYVHAMLVNWKSINELEVLPKLLKIQSNSFLLKLLNIRSNFASPKCKNTQKKILQTTMNNQNMKTKIRRTLSIIKPKLSLLNFINIRSNLDPNFLKCNNILMKLILLNRL